MRRRRTSASGQDPGPLRNLVLVLGDQLDRSSSAFDGFDARLDAVWMAEAAAEAKGLRRRADAIRHEIDFREYRP